MAYDALLLVLLSAPQQPGPPREPPIQPQPAVEAQSQTQAQTPTESGFDGGAYLTVSGTGSVSLETTQSHRPGAAGRSAGGYLWALPNQLKVYVGGGFEHRAFHLGTAAREGRQSGAFATVRVGRGTNKLWGYGLFTPGLSTRLNPSDGLHASVTMVASLEVGGGVAVRLWRGLFVGGELSIDTGTDVFDSGAREDLSFANARLMTGWSF